ncbi:MAG TPA: glycosyltransferase [Muricauda sp.]|nr:glycosyltransferase family 2 protein [uncultured Allomuricauda sp.]MBC73627.1 glycosyltransferase [Allomuricauda sp.]HBU79852.1 glycosyltransferase [Allomuricauda sp.]|tara:strand:- start:5301 stop:6185 length:885 start_codon:yes stop_codon:yes gene_type:complete
MKTLTVFTPSFNRAYCLDQLYNSLVQQSSKDFCWLIIDDGSSDNTKELVQSWIDENLIDIQYHHQENQGMHGGHNSAYKLIKTELNLCIDSDDFMPANGVELILKQWSEVKDKPHLAGIIGLDADKSGKILGTKMPEGIEEATLYDLHHKYKVTGDKKLILRTAVVREFPPYPIYKDERLVPLGTLYLQIDQKYKYKCANEIYCIVEYLEDGSSRNILKQYKRSPRGFLYSRILEMKYSKSWTYTFTRAMHYISSCIFIKKWNILSGNPKKVTTILALPFGILLHVYILLKIRK